MEQAVFSSEARKGRKSSLSVLISFRLGSILFLFFLRLQYGDVAAVPDRLDGQDGSLPEVLLFHDVDQCGVCRAVRLVLEDLGRVLRRVVEEGQGDQVILRHVVADHADEPLVAAAAGADVAFADLALDGDGLVPGRFELIEEL